MIYRIYRNKQSMRFNIFFFFLFISGLCAYGQDSPHYSSYIKNIKNRDTLTLIGYFSDCEEWGGHTEYIYLYKNDSALWFTYKNDSIKCARIATPEHKELVEVSKLLNFKQTEIISNYIESLFEFKKSLEGDGPEAISNGPNCYYIRTKDTSIEVCDHELKWGLFQKTVIALLK